MPNKVTIEKVESLARQLQPAEQLRLLGNISMKLSDSLFSGSSRKGIIDKKTRQERLQLAEELISECKEIDDDSKGSTNGLGMLRRMRDERIGRICRKGV
jgi:hypothetical protein